MIISGFIKVLADIKKRTNKDFEQILGVYTRVSMSMNTIPWKFTIWNEVERKVIGNNRSLVELLFLYIYHKYGHPIMHTKEINPEFRKCIRSMQDAKAMAT